MVRPDVSEYAPYYETYVSLVPEPDILRALEKQLAEVQGTFGSVTPDRETFRYAEGKWSIRETLGHLVDGERVFAFRAFCFSRAETAAMPSFDQNAYIVESRYGERPLPDLLQEFVELRKSNLRFFRSLDGDRWSRSGTASGSPVTVRALAFIMAGHVRHHLSILRDRYGVRSVP